MTSIEYITEKTGCLYLSYNCIPFYRISEKEWILMDSGYRNDGKDLLSYLTEHDITVKAALCTHAHFDHVGNHRLLKETFGTKIILTLYDAAVVGSNLNLKSIFYSSTEEEIQNDYENMIVTADEIILPGQTEVIIEGETFRVLPLHGHATSHVGFITPDQVAYLGDSLQSPEIIEKEKITYMIRWKEQFRTMELLKTLSCPYYILAHKGVYQDLAPVIEINYRALHRQLEKIRGLITEPMTLEQITATAFDKLRIFPAPMGKVLIIERTIRHFVEYLMETRKLRRYMKDGMLYYEWYSIS